MRAAATEPHGLRRRVSTPAEQDQDPMVRALRDDSTATTSVHDFDRGCEAAGAPAGRLRTTHVFHARRHGVDDTSSMAADSAVVKPWERGTARRRPAGGKGHGQKAPPRFEPRAPAPGSCAFQDAKTAPRPQEPRHGARIRRRRATIHAARIDSRYKTTRGPPIMDCDTQSGGVSHAAMMKMMTTP